MSGELVREIVVAALLVAGGLLSLSAGVGLWRFPDVLSRMHAATKPQVLGLACILAATAVKFPTWGTISTLVLVALFQMMTTPIGAHMLGRAAYREVADQHDELVEDELGRAIRMAEKRERIAARRAAARDAAG